MTEKDEHHEHQNKEQGEKAGQEFIPPLDFSSIVLPFYMQALLKLGLMDDPSSGSKPEQSLDLAKRLIDILDLLRDRTKGNLSPEEERFLESCLVQMKQYYLEKSNIIKT